MKPLRSNILSKPMYGYQVKGFNFIHYHGACYLMQGMGLGKSRQCIEVGRTIDYPLFILANKWAALDTWPKEFRKWDKTAKVAVLHGPHKERIWANSDKYTNIIMTYGGLKWFAKTAMKRLRPLQKYMFVFDEASMIKDHTTIRWDILDNLRGMMSPYKVALSGTPAPQSLSDLWAQYFMLDGGKALGADYYQFRSRFFDYTGADGDPPHQTTIKPWAEEKIFDLIAPMTMRLATEDYHDLPEIHYNHIKITMPAKLRKMYDKLEEEFMLEFPNATVIANSAAVRTHKLRQFLQGAIYAVNPEEFGSQHRLSRVTQDIHDIKQQVVKELIETAQGRPMMVAGQFNFEWPKLDKVLGNHVPRIIGGTSEGLGKNLINSWNQNKLPILGVHPKSVAYSLNLQEGGSDLVFAALPWELDLYDQLLARLVRPHSRHERVTVTTIGFRNTADDVVAECLKRKDMNQEKLFSAIINRRNK